MPRYFTVAEANALLPIIKPHIEQLVRSWQHIMVNQKQVVELLQEHPHVDMGGPFLSIIANDIIRSQNAMMTIQALGVQLKDPNTGLIDFPCMYNGQEVYLCWRRGEDQIAFWHTPDAGFAGRRPIDDLNEQP